MRRLTLFAGRFLRRRAVFWMRRRQDQGAGPPPALFFRDLKRQGRGRPCYLRGVTCLSRLDGNQNDPTVPSRRRVGVAQYGVIHPIAGMPWNEFKWKR